MKKPTTKSEKVSLGITISIWVIGAVLLVLAIFSKQIFGENSFFSSVFGSANEEGSITLWDKLVAFLPELLKCVVLVIIVIGLSKLLRVIIQKGLLKFKKGQTVGKLIDSFVKYAAGFIIIFMVLNTFGVDMATLLAGAGILGLVIGLGAQSLIADIIAGLFIVFEGDYQVGDIVVIEDWRGTVKEIGIRTTKIEDVGGNVKIIGNSSIKSLINQTKELSLARCVVGTEYGDSIERIEVVIKNNIDSIKEQISTIEEGPFYKGVAALNSSSVDLLFVAKCKEENVYQVERDLNRAIKIMFDKNKVNIPFPQVVLNQPSESSSVATSKTKKAAAAFVEEQKDLSKGIEDEYNS